MRPPRVDLIGVTELAPTTRLPEVPAGGTDDGAGDGADDAADLAVNALAALLADTHLRRQRWELALAADERNDPEACLEHCRALLVEAPHHRDALLLGARAARDLRRWAVAAELLATVLEGEPPPSPLDWDRLAAATVSGDAVGVQASVARLGLDPAHWLAPEGFVMVVIGGRAHVARRTGPATARILSIASGGRPQHVDDEVAYDARPAEPGDVTGRAHRVLGVLRPGTSTVWALTGRDPGFDVWEDAVALLAGRGWTLRRTTRFDPAHAAGTVGVLAVPAGVRADEVDDVLRTATGSWGPPVAWAATTR